MTYFRCPDDVYISKLNTSHASIINDLWPHKYNGSEKYIETFIAINGGYGIFLENNHQLVSWILINHLGILGALQTVQNYKRRGYGAIMIKMLSKHMAEEGYTPMALILNSNQTSGALFRLLGFKVFDEYTYIEV